MAIKTDFKLIANGHILELYQYQHGVYSDFDGQGGRRGKDEDKSDRNAEYRKQTNQNNRNEVRRKVQANFSEHSKFISLTFKENRTDVKECNGYFKNFIDRLRYYIKHKTDFQEKFKYLAVIEFQERGAVHYHMICNAPFIKWDILLKMWRKASKDDGGLDIRDITNVDNVGAYMVKYMVKDMGDDRLAEQKAYLSSQGLQKESVIRGNIATAILKDIYGIDPSEESTKKVFTNSYISEHHGEVNYTEFNLKRNN